MKIILNILIQSVIEVDPCFKPVRVPFHRKRTCDVCHALAHIQSRRDWCRVDATPFPMKFCEVRPDINRCRDISNVLHGVCQIVLLFALINPDLIETGDHEVGSAKDIGPVVVSLFMISGLVVQDICNESYRNDSGTWECSELALVALTRSQLRNRIR